jgi:TRAP-type transport system small permease protein
VNPHSAPRPHRLLRLAEIAMALTLAVMVVAVFANVVLRYGFNTGIVSYEELSRLLFVWLVCIGAVVATAERKHLGFDLLVARLPRPAARACGWLARALMLFGLVLLIKGSWGQVIAGLGTVSAVIGYPMALAAAAPLLMAVGMAALLLLEVLRGLPAPSLPIEQPAEAAIE